MNVELCLLFEYVYNKVVVYLKLFLSKLCIFADRQIVTIGKNIIGAFKIPNNWFFQCCYRNIGLFTFTPHKVLASNYMQYGKNVKHLMYLSHFNLGFVSSGIVLGLKSDSVKQRKSYHYRQKGSFKEKKERTDTNYKVKIM